MKKTILVIEDDPGLQDVFRLILEKAGYKVEILNNGQAILDNLFSLPDLFLLDKQLSGTDGLVICRYLKSTVLTKNIPVIMISASIGINDLAKAAGADNFMAKPFEVPHLLSMVADYV